MPLLSRIRGVSWFAIKAVCVCHCITEYLFEVVYCVGPSMEPTIQSSDIVIAESISVRNKTLKKNDLIIAKSVDKADQLICKRLVHFQGEQVNGTIFPKKVKKDHVWLAGDNINNSTDSRTYGDVPFGLIKSRIIARVWPNPTVFLK